MELLKDKRQPSLFFKLGVAIGISILLVLSLSIAPHVTSVPPQLYNQPPQQTSLQQYLASNLITSSAEEQVDQEGAEELQDDVSILIVASPSQSSSFHIWVSEAYTINDSYIRMRGNTTTNTTVLTTPAIRYRNVTIYGDGIRIVLGEADAINLTLKMKYMKARVKASLIITIDDDIEIRGAYVRDGLLGGLGDILPGVDLAPGEVVDSYLSPLLASNTRMYNVYIIAEELSLTLRSKNVTIRL